MTSQQKIAIALIAIPVPLILLVLFAYALLSFLIVEITFTPLWGVIFAVLQIFIGVGGLVGVVGVLFGIPLGVILLALSFNGEKEKKTAKKSKRKKK